MSTFAYRWRGPVKDKISLPDESGWCYSPDTRSDRDGKARLTDEYGIRAVVARHFGRELVAVQAIARGRSKEAVTVTLHPQCRISGRLTSQELQSHGRKITWSNVYLYLGDDSARPMSCISEKGEFQFYLPPGAYKLDAYATETHGLFKTVTVRSRQRELEVEPIDLPPKRLVLLEGQPAPEFREVTAWKNSGPIKLADLRGKVVILEFWGYWCNPCVGRMPGLFSVYDKYHDQGLVVIGCHDDAGDRIDSVAKLDAKLVSIKTKLWKGRDLPFPVALLQGHKVPYRPEMKQTARSQLAADYGVDGYPTGVLIDRHGRVVGEFSAGYEPAEAALKKALAEK